MGLVNWYIQVIVSLVMDCPEWYDMRMAGIEWVLDEMQIINDQFEYSLQSSTKPSWLYDLGPVQTQIVFISWPSTLSLCS